MTLPPNAPCKREGCNEPRRVNSRTGKQESYCAQHEREYHNSKASVHRRKQGAKPRVFKAKAKRFIIDRASGRAQRIVGGVVIQDVALRGGRAHPHLATVMKAQGYRIEERG